MRLQAVEERIDAELHLGGHIQVITELRQLVAANPLRERGHTLLMLALYKNGQRAEALAAYQSARSVLADELGVEPGAQMRQIQQQILAGPVGPANGSLIGADGPRESASEESRQPPAVVPRQLPAAAPHFSGRSPELATLTDWANQADVDTVVISAIAGTAGIGKTALAVHWAHGCASRFPDGQLYINLHGFGPAGPPVTPADAVRLLLDSLGIPPERIPADPDAREAMYRSHLAGRKMLIILDNATDPAQVRPLLPGSAGCLVLVTSRNQLIGLVAADGANLLTLDVMTEPEARQMLALRLTPARVAAESAAVTELIRLCARLPLALSIAAARAAARPALPLASLVAELRDTHARLDALDTGDAATDMRTVLSWSCQQLPAPTARMFRLLGLHPGPDITIPAAASLAGVPLPQSQQAITDLTREHLITEHQTGRYSCHDLLRAYAAEQARGHDSEQDRHGALHRVLDHYLHTTFAASLLLGYRIPIGLSALSPGVVPEELTDRQQALDWFQAERQVLLAAVRQAADSRFSVHAWQLPWTMTNFLDWFGYWHELAAIQQSALAAAERLSDPAGQCEARRYLARGRIRLGDDAEAIEHLTAAIELAAQAGNDTLHALAHIDLGGVFESQGRMREALAQAEHARGLYRKAGRRWGEAMALSAVGWSHSQLGNYHDALDFCGQAMVIFRELKIVQGQSATLDTLGYAHHELGQYAEAITCFGEAMSIDGDACDQRARVEILIHLGDSHHAAGNHQAAREAWQEALALLEGLNQPTTERVHSRLSQHPPSDLRKK
jgi:tetratricopeptide (TPR) repeat protein